MFSLDRSRHAVARSQQRGVPDDLLQALVDFADVDTPVGSGCRVFRISKKALRDAKVRKLLGPAADRLAKLALIWSDDSGEVVTVLHDHGTSSGRRYRRTH